MTNTIEFTPGTSVRATALVIGTEYMMTTWTKERTRRKVKFMGFGSFLAPVTPIPQLKTLTAESKFYFIDGDDMLVADGRVAGNVFIGEGTGHRVTFHTVVSSYEDVAGGSLDSPLTDPALPVKELVEA